LFSVVLLTKTSKLGEGWPDDIEFLTHYILGDSRLGIKTT
jgi:hypothetical protein